MQEHLKRSIGKEDGKIVRGELKNSCREGEARPETALGEKEGGAGEEDVRVGGEVVMRRESFDCRSKLLRSFVFRETRYV